MINPPLNSPASLTFFCLYVVAALVTACCTCITPFVDSHRNRRSTVFYFFDTLDPCSSGTVSVVDIHAMSLPPSLPQSVSSMQYVHSVEMIYAVCFPKHVLWASSSSAHFVRMIDHSPNNSGPTYDPPVQLKIRLACQCMLASITISTQ